MTSSKPNYFPETPFSKYHHTVDQGFNLCILGGHDSVLSDILLTLSILCQASVEFCAQASPHLILTPALLPLKHGDQVHLELGVAL